MAFDAHKNLAVSTVATAPSPATSGTSLVVPSGHGLRFPAAPFNATIWPDGSLPDPGNAEIVRVTAVATDTLTITRAQEGSVARTVVNGDLIAAGITAKTATDLEARLDAIRAVPVSSTPSVVTVPGVVISGTNSTRALVANTDYYQPILADTPLTFDQILLEVTTAATAGATCRVALCSADLSWQPTGSLIEDFGTFAADTTGIKTLTPAGGSRTIGAGRYLLMFNTSAAVTLRVMRGSPGSVLVLPGLTNTFTVLEFTAARAHGAFPSTPVAWTTAAPSAVGHNFSLFLRVTAVV